MESQPQNPKFRINAENFRMLKSSELFSCYVFHIKCWLLGLKFTNACQNSKQGRP